MHAQGILIYYQNAHSVCGKIDKLHSNLFQLLFSPDIIIITELWLNNNISSNELRLRGYSIFKYDRNFEAMNVRKGVKFLLLYVVTFNPHLSQLNQPTISNSSFD